MKNFFNPNNKKGKKPQIKNPFAPKPNYGGGQSLGGSRPGKVLSISMKHPGPLGVKVEKRPNTKTAIIATVVPNTQAEEVGLMRGDVVCHANTQGQSEMEYDVFLKMAASSTRPLVFDVRRIEGSLVTSTNATNTSAEAEARRRAVIAAAEKRDRAHKAKSKPIPKVSTEGLLLSTAEKQQLQEERAYKEDKPLSLEAQRAVQAAKQQEEVLSAQLGYNPYETNKSSAGQARTATVAMTHGTIQANNNNGGDSKMAAVAPPPQTAAVPTNAPPVSPAFEDAFATMVTTHEGTQTGLASSLSVLRKLMVNATTKGQASFQQAKFRRVRLSNAKIKAAITDMHGALEVMLSVGFQLSEEDGETYLVYPFPSKGPEWLPRALETMQQYETLET